jgi:hypothetical protein
MLQRLCKAQRVAQLGQPRRCNGNTHMVSSFSINRCLLPSRKNTDKRSIITAGITDTLVEAQTAAHEARAPQKLPMRQHVLLIGSLQSSCRTRTNTRRVVRFVIIAVPNMTFLFPHLSHWSFANMNSPYFLLCWPPRSPAKVNCCKSNSSV